MTVKEYKVENINFLIEKSVHLHLFDSSNAAGDLEQMHRRVNDEKFNNKAP